MPGVAVGNLGSHQGSRVDMMDDVTGDVKVQRRALVGLEVDRAVA